MKKTLFDKVWDAHVVDAIDNGPQILYIDKHLIHEVTSPQAFNELTGDIKIFIPKINYFLNNFSTFPNIN